MSFKDTFFNKVFTIRNLFLGGNFILLVVFLGVVVKDHVREWKPFQRQFLKMESRRLHEALEKASTDEDKNRITLELAAVKGQGVHIRQVMLPRMDRYDRCITCHTAQDPAASPTQTSPYDEHPFKAPDNAIHKAHPIEKFGCTVCHSGQGLGTTVKGAHGEVKHWEKPLLRGALLQASCAKCHSNVWDEKAMPYTAAWRRGEELFREKGCIGCHQVRGQGGPISVDLADETADKPLGRIDFSHTGLPKEEQTLANWIKVHFTKPPSELVPGDPEAHYNTEPIAPSGMPFFDLSNEDADAVTTYVLSMSRDNVPVDLMAKPAVRPEPVYKTATERGRAVYVKNGCAACHGPAAKGGVPNFNYENGVTPDLTKTVSTYTRHELQEKIENGVPLVGKADVKGATPPLYMPPWKDKIKGQDMEDLLTYLYSIAEKSEEW